jgi:hypothetical protein
MGALRRARDTATERVEGASTLARADRIVRVGRSTSWSRPASCGLRSHRTATVTGPSAGDLVELPGDLLHADVWYAVELSSQRRDWLPPMFAWRAGLTEGGTRGARPAAALLAAVMRVCRRGFAATLPSLPTLKGSRVHCVWVGPWLHFIVLGLGVAFSPPPDLAARASAFPWTPAGARGRRCCGATAAWPAGPIG